MDIVQSFEFNSLQSLKDYFAKEPFRDLGTYSLIYKLSGNVDGPYFLEYSGIHAKTRAELDWEFETFNHREPHFAVQTVNGKYQIAIIFPCQLEIFVDFENGIETNSRVWDRRTWKPLTTEEIVEGFKALAQEFRNRKSSYL